jgi:hypothetical protein
MQIFVDILLPDGSYVAAAEPSFMAPRMPISILTAVVFLDAAGAGDPASRPRLFHVESGRYVDEPTLAEAGVGQHDTLVIVNCDDADAATPREVGLRWQREGGTARRGMRAMVDLAPAARAARARA